MILDQIVTEVRRQLLQRCREVPLAEVQSMAARRGDVLDFHGALKRGGIGLIAEVKRSSPSRGRLHPDMDVPMLVRRYVAGGASALSVLTEPNFFEGSLADLALARQSSALPLLRKDFIIDPYQIFEARAYGADAVLLIVAILSVSELADFMAVARGLGMGTLVEVHNELEAERALAAGANLIGVNNRNLANFSVDVNTTFKLLPLLGPGVDVVSESGIRHRADVVALEDAGVRAILVGEALVTAADPGARIRELLGRPERD